MRMSLLSRFCLITLTVITLNQTASAAATLNSDENNALVKEDIAGTQVLSEVCPALIGKNAKFEQNIQKLIQMNLKQYTGQTMTLSVLQNDAEYKALLDDAHKAVKETPADEQKSVCEDVLNFED
ncbi:MCR_0457 family protein [Acinetobacter ihumii]|uniref:MCR_0457 family protein n=1 Tax=Acinetobacter ihumii TaxID=2483802 RepID=UPI001030FCE6|nr:hypothetical protein [Acinetobacter ihumii]